MTSTKPCIVTTRQRPEKTINARWVNGVWVKRQRVKLARIILEQKLGRPIKEGYLACHICNNGLCIEPDHIYEGTYGDNLIDAYNVNKSNGRDHKTHCAQGHEFTLENTGYYRSVGRDQYYCRICRRKRIQEWRARQR